MAMANLRTIPIHQSMNRPNLFMGGDREMTMFTALLCGALVFTALRWESTIFGVTLWFVTLFLLRLMAKSDVQMRHVYLRHIRYKRYYPARSTPWRENTTAQANNYK